MSGSHKLGRLFCMKTDPPTRWGGKCRQSRDCIKAELNQIRNFLVARVLYLWLGFRDQPGIFPHLTRWTKALCLLVF